MIKTFQNHYIICGFGETGKSVAKEMYATQRQMVIIDNRHDIHKEVEAFFRSDIPTIEGNATEEDILISAGIEKAAGMILTLPEDKDNLFVLVTAKSINKNILIASKVDHEHNCSKFLNAGASKVVTPSAIGGMRLASEVLRPTVTTFLDLMLRDRDKNLRIDEIELHEGMECFEKTLEESNFRGNTNVLIMAIAFSNGDFIYNPPAKHKLEKGQRLIVLGESKDIGKFKNMI
ncbi:MAG TPA: TrkA family potassium uptake protein [bacterium]|nr:TrkA family potassium uptake protein [bacterium]HPS29435.1 TrkA family potassium uptake protein [bacterium]